MNPVEIWRQTLGERASHHQKTSEMVRGSAVPYHRRGVLSVPAYRGGAALQPEVVRTRSLQMMAKAALLPVDALFFDLEDAAPDQPAFKALARQFCAEALATTDFGPRLVGFRPNAIRSLYFTADLDVVLAAAGHRLDFIVIPKSESAVEVADIADLVAALGRALGWPKLPRLEVLIESPRAFFQAHAIAAIPLVSALVFGAYDFARCIGSQVHAQTWLADQLLVRQMLPIIAAAHGKHALDAVTATLPVRPKDGLPTPDAVAARQVALDLAHRDAADACRLGFAGKWVLHPDQIAPIQAAFGPTAEQAGRALRLCADYARAAMAGSGAERDQAQPGQVRLIDKAVAGMEFWVVQAGLRYGVLTDPDVAATGLTLAQLRAASLGPQLAGQPD